MIIVVDFGSQTTHLIGRRLREIGVTNQIVDPENISNHIQDKNVKGIILSGGPGDAYKKDALTVDRLIFNLNIPVLGICYGEQVIAQVLGGGVTPGKKKEFGPAELQITQDSPLFVLPITDDQGLTTINVWMNHGDEVSSLPNGFTTIGKTDTIPYAAIADEKRKLYGIQFHPEVVHTQFGLDILKNFARICRLKPKDQPMTTQFIEGLIADIKESVGGAQVIGALSGGVDSSIACLMVHRAIGDQFTPVYIDSGLMREGETDELQKVFKQNYDM